MTPLLDGLRASLSLYTPQTQRDYLFWTTRFLQRHPDPARWAPQDLLGFLGQLKADGCKAASVHKAAYAIKKAYLVAERPTPAFRLRLPAVDILAQARPRLTQEEVGRLIQASLAGRYPDGAALVALVSVYGVRGAEVAAFVPQYLDLEAGTVTFATGKGEAPRIHGIPDPIRPVLAAKTFARPRSKVQLWAWWQHLERQAKIPDRERQGWHALRRSLVYHLLQAGVPRERVWPWMGWKLQAMVDLYPLGTREELDAEMFAHHPFLPLWAALVGLFGAK